MPQRTIVHAPAPLLALALALAAPAQDTRPALTLDVQGLAQIELLARVDGFDAALAELRLAVARAQVALGAGSADERALLGAFAALERAAVLEARLLAGAGRSGEAQAVLARPLPLPEGAPARARQLAETFSPSAERRELQRELAVAVVAQGKPADDVASTVVLDALTRGDEAVLVRLGASVADVYEALARSMRHPTALIATSRGPLYWLIEAAPGRGATVALELSRRAGSGWQAAVAAELTATRVGALGRGTLAAWQALHAAADCAALVEALATSKELGPETRQKLGSGLFYAPLQGPAAEALVAEGTVALEREGRSRNDDVVAAAPHWLGAEDVRLRRFAAQAVCTAPNDVALLERLAADPDSGVRAAVARVLDGSALALTPATPTATAVWRRLLNDSDAEVRVAAYRALARHGTNPVRQGSNTYRTSPIPFAELTQLVQRFADPSERDVALAALSGQGSGEFSYLFMCTEATPAERAAAFSVLARSPLPMLSERALSATGQLDGPGMAEFLRAYDWSQGVGQKYHSALTRGIGALDPKERGQLLCELLLRPGFPHELERSVACGDDIQKLRGVLAAVPAERLAPALVRLIERWERNDLTTALSGVAWAELQRPLEVALGALAQGTAPSLKQATLVAVAAQAASGGQPCAAAAGWIDRLAAADPASARAELELASSFLYRAPEASLALLQAALDHPALQTGPLAGFSAPDRPHGGYPLPLAAAVLDRMEARCQAGGAAGDFLYAAREFARTMAAAPGLYRPALARVWRGEERSTLAAAALAAGDLEVVELVRSEALQRARALDNSSQEWQVSLALEAVLAVPGEASERALAELAASTGSTKVRDAIVGRLERVVAARELAARLRRTSTLDDERRAAAERLVALLDAAGPADPGVDAAAVRIEAIRGLATLGAVEHLPRLVELAGSGTPAERSAAKEALDVLFRAAAAGRPSGQGGAPVTEGR